MEIKMEKEVVDFEGEKVKMSKVEKFFLNQKEKFNKHIEGFEAHLGKKIEDFIKEANAAIKKSDTKFSNLYSVLMREFLTKLEQRIYSNELATRTMIKSFGEKLYSIESKLEMISSSKEEYMKDFEDSFVKTMSQLNDEIAEEMSKSEVKNEEVSTEVVEPILSEEEATKAE
jgi:CII-binding regulator of phage lambda lysogenization HflD